MRCGIDADGGRGRCHCSRRKLLLPLSQFALATKSHLRQRMWSNFCFLTMNCYPPQLVHGPYWCRIWTFPLKCITDTKNWGKIGEEDHRILTPNESILTFRAPNFRAKFHQNRTKIATVAGRADRQTDRQKDASDFIICHMLRYIYIYSNGTDNNMISLQSEQSATDDSTVSYNIAHRISLVYMQVLAQQNTTNKKAVLSQGNRAMPQLLFLV